MSSLPVFLAIYGYCTAMAIGLVGIKRGCVLPHAYLGILLVVLSTAIVFRFEGQAFLLGALPFLYGPLLFFHIGALLFPSRDWSPKRFLTIHLWPYAILQAYLLSGLQWASGRIIYSVLENLSIFLYLFFSARLMRSFVAPAQNYHTRGIVVWSRLLIMYGVAVTVFAFLQSVSGNAMLESLFLPMMCSAFLILPGFFSILYPEIFIETLAAAPVIRKYARSGLREKEARVFEEKLVKYLENGRPWMSASVSLRDVSDALGINPVYLSQVINERFQKTFLELMNGYRVRAAAEKLTSPSHDGSILQVAFEVGFNSKATFYSAFRREFGLTPSGYIRAKSASKE